MEGTKELLAYDGALYEAAYADTLNGRSGPDRTRMVFWLILKNLKKNPSG